MGLAAIAYHEVISLSQLEEVFKPNYNAVFGCTMAGTCPKCETRFAVFFPVKDDTDNPQYLAQLMKMIGDGCRGAHSPTYSLLYH